jgi:hypothetical protein
MPSPSPEQYRSTSSPGYRAAIAAGRRVGISGDDAVVLQETNNTVVWLCPHPVVAKVATRADSTEGLRREHEVATALCALGAPVAEPLPGVGPIVDRSTGLTVTLWRRLVHDPDVHVSGPMVGDSLGGLHDTLAAIAIPLPDFRLGIKRARAALSDADTMAPLPEQELVLLRDAFDALLPWVDDRAYVTRGLHGEPHDGNRLATTSGIRWIDLESVCRGPLEWDLAFLCDEARQVFGPVDPKLLAVLSILNSARVATWCSTRSSARFPHMLRHGHHHLERVRRTWPSLD